MSFSRRALSGTAALLAVVLAAPAGAQDRPPSPLSDFVVTGYGTLGYTSSFNGPADDFHHDFSAAISPVFLFNMGNDFLFEAEFEFEVAGAETETALEYAQVDYLGFDRVQITAGKFLLPLGLFGERLHPTWINKMPSMPLLYGHAHGGVAEGALLPVLSDFGVMGRWAQPLSGSLTLDVSAWVTQGPRPAATEGADAGDDGHAHNLVPSLGRTAGATAPDLGPAAQVTPTPAELAALPSVAFGTNTADNNDNKMLGARAGLVAGGDFEFHVSGFHAMYDEGDFLDVYSGNVAFEWRPERFEIRGEGAVLWQQVLLEETAVYETMESPGYYVQASRRFGPFEPVARWSHLLDSELGTAVVRDEVRQLALGLDYWFTPSIPLKTAFEVNLDGEERVLVQWAYGF